ncbi:MAG: zinc metalloprotease HtpX [Candidatus Bathyarchaeia archaeon]
MSIWKLRLSMLGSLALIIGLSTLFFAAVLSILGASLLFIGIFVVAANFIQWLMAPYIIDALYRVREIPENENPRLHEVIENLSRKSGIKKPKVMLAQIPIPNAFAYGSPIAGNRVAVTSGLMKTLDFEEVEAVIGHELGHLKHRDVQIMMFASLLPALLYYIGYTLVISSMFRKNQRDSGGGGIAILGIAMYAIAMFINLVCVTLLSRTREYYADKHSASIVEDGSRKLSEALAKIVYNTKNMGRIRNETQNFNAFKALFITDPDRADADSTALSAVSSDQKLVQEILSREITTAEKIVEIFSTHPNIVKRLRALQELS